MVRVAVVLIIWLSSPVVAQEKGKAEFIETQYDFGEIKEEEGPVVHQFEFKNTGMTPLVVRGVRASCGCTTPAWSKEPILPGEMGFIQAQYNPRNRPGVFRKSLTVSTDGEIQSIYLYINGSVLPKPKTIEDDFKVKVGATRFKSRSINIGNITTQMALERSVEIYNDSDSAVSVGLKVSAPEFIKLTFDPEIIQAKQKGVVRVWYDPNHDNALGYNNHSVTFSTNEPISMNKQLNVVANITEYFPELTEAEKQKAPQMLIPDRIHNFGKLEQNVTVMTEYTLTNNGHEELNIRKIKSNCGCIVPSISSNDIKPGESTLLKVQFNTKGRRGSQTKSIHIYSNDPLDPTQTITVKANVIPKS